MIQAVNKKRIRTLNNESNGSGPVIYWMSRDQRVNDNWSLIIAREIALENKVPFIVVFCLVPSFLEATERQYGFMLKGLAEIENLLQTLDISFCLLTGNPEVEIDSFCREQQAGALVCDFSPLKINRQWKEMLVKKLPVAFYEVDAHNIIPCWVTSSKQEYAAYTIRPKIKKLLSEYLTDIPKIGKHPFPPPKPAVPIDWHKATQNLRIDRSIKEVMQFTPGEKAARETMRHFIENKLVRYDKDRNNPNLDGQSNLSPYLHFGHLSAQRLALMVKGTEEPGVQPENYLEELIVRRELSVNYCFYNDHYDTVKAFPRWASESLDKHTGDPREYLYKPEEFEKAKTHDPLWNAAQMEMVSQGKMHGYMRMYWAKKILEWTDLPEEAMKIAIYLNDKYSLDGRDPNGYAGIAWSIGGVHDRAWKERPIFGKVRYMSYRGSKSKFNVDEYIANNS
ncbi:MAG: deoxyribodipyrimidine photo-lyase [Bacillota bacterium]